MTDLYPVTLVLPDGEVTLPIAADQFIWKAAGEAGIALPARCGIGWCLTCAARLLAPGQFDASRAVRYYPEDRAAGFLLLCTTRPRSPLRILTHQSRRHARVPPVARPARAVGVNNRRKRITSAGQLSGSRLNSA